MEKGTLAYINYTLRAKGDDRVIETTIEDVAKEAGVHDPSIKYKPLLVAVGDGWVVEGLDEALLEMEEGRRTVEVPPEKAYGHRDPSRIKLMPLRKFGENASKLKVGDRVEIDGQIGIVSYIGSGRVAVDFNHRLAGKTLIYDVEMVRELKRSSEKVKALVVHSLRLDEKDVGVKVREGTATVTLPIDRYIEGETYLKRTAASNVFKYVLNVHRLIFQEIYEAPKKEAQATPTSSTSEQASS